MNKKVKKTRKLGKWINGYDGKLTQAYKQKRKKKLKIARKSRKLNHRIRKGMHT